MVNEGLERIVGEHKLFAGLGEAFITLAAGCAKNVRFDANQYLFRAEEPADWIYLIRHGRVAMEVVTPGRGAVQFLTVSENEVVGICLAVAALSLELRRARHRTYPSHRDGRALPARQVRSGPRSRLCDAEAIPAGAGATSRQHDCRCSMSTDASLSRARCWPPDRCCRASRACCGVRASCRTP